MRDILRGDLGAKKFQIKRGLKANLPVLSDGEPAFTTDESHLYIGNNGTNVEIPNRKYIDEHPYWSAGQIFVGENPPTDGSKLIQIIDVEEPESFQAATIEEVNESAATRYPQPYETTTGHIATCTDANAGTCYPMIYGKSVQNGTPTPEAPVAVQSAQSPLSVEISQTFSNAYIIQDAIRKGTIKNYVSVGDYFTIGRGGTDWLFQVAAFDYDVPVETQFTHSMRLLMYPCFANVPFDAPEAIYYAAAELAAGTYWFINNRTNKYYSFTTTQAIPVGGQAAPVFGASPDYAITQIKTYASQTSTTALETVTATISDTAPTIGTQLTPVNDDIRSRWGNNNWMQSAIRQWLNSAATTGWWTAKNIYDRPQSSPTDGFLNGIDADLLACIGKVRLRTGLNPVDNAGVFGSSDNEELIFLPSRTEMGLGNSATAIYETPVAADGTAKTDTLPLFKSNADRVKYLAGVARSWWMRSPYQNATSVSTTYIVNLTGALDGNIALNGVGAVPACVIY